MAKQTLRVLYYLSIGILVLYALPSMPFYNTVIKPVLDFHILGDFTILSAIAVLVAIGAIQSYRRRFG